MTDGRAGGEPTTGALTPATQGYSTFITTYYVLCSSVLLLVVLAAWLAQVLRKDEQAMAQHKR